MKALVFHGNKDVRLQEVEDPTPGPGEVKLRIDYCGICATDIEEYQFGPKFISSDPPNPLTGKGIPIIIGHELTGTVVDSGPDVGSINVGDRVVINGILTCGQCRWCRGGKTNQCPSRAVIGFGIEGGLAEYMSWSASKVIRLPDTVSSRAAALSEPAAVAHHAVRRGRVRQGERVAVLGVGTVGLLAVQMAKAAGATVYALDRRPMSLEMATQLGADATIHVDETDAGGVLRDLTEGDGPDLVIDAAGASHTPALAVELARVGGRVVLVAIYTATTQIDFNTVVGTEKELIGSVAYDQRDVEAVVQLMASGSVKTTPLISDIIGLDEAIGVGYARMLAPDKDVFRILVAPS